MSVLLRNHTKLVACPSSVVGVALLLLLTASSSPLLADPILNVYVGHKTFYLGETTKSFNITMNSVEDYVGGFQLWLTIADPFVLRFDMNNPVDVAGSTIYNWEMIDWGDFGTQGKVLKIIGLPRWPEKSPDAPGPIPPSDVPQLLLTVNTVVFDPRPDTLCGFTDGILLNPYQTKFSDNDPISQIIGWDTWAEYDTTYENCVEWIGDSCISWADTIVDTTHYSQPNFDLLNYQDGSYTFGCFICGDANGSGGDPAVDIDDVVFLISYIFASGTPPDPIEAGDANCSGGDPAIDIDDVIYLITYIFASGPEPCAGCS